MLSRLGVRPTTLELGFYHSKLLLMLECLDLDLPPEGMSVEMFDDITLTTQEMERIYEDLKYKGVDPDLADTFEGYLEDSLEDILYTIEKRRQN